MKSKFVNILSSIRNIDNNKLYYHDENSKIYCDDILNFDKLPENSVNLIVTSPPYNLDISYKSNDDNMEYDSYLEFTKHWLTKCYTFLAEDGRMCLNIPLDTNLGGHRSIYSDIVQVAKNVGYNYFTTVIWNEGNVSNRLAWGSWMSASSPNIITPVECIVVFYKKFWKRISIGKSTIERDEFIDWTNGLWAFCGESKKRIGHPAPFPIELPMRCIKLFSYMGDTVFDPFLGSGTTVVASKLLGRNSIGVDKEIEYCDLAYHRILKETKNLGGLN